MGRKFFEVERTSPNDVYAICAGNGLNEKQTSAVMKDAEQYDFDLRRVKKAVHKQKRMK